MIGYKNKIQKSTAFPKTSKEKFNQEKNIYCLQQKNKTTTIYQRIKNKSNWTRARPVWRKL